MMGLLYKDLMVQRKQLGYYLVIMVVYAVMVANGALTVGILGGLVVLVGMMMPMTSFSYDDLARWDKYAAATPAGRRGIVTSKYLFALVSTLLAAVPAFALQSALVLLGLAEGSVAEQGLILLACAGIGLFINAVMLPIFIKFGAEKSRLVAIVLFVVFFGGTMLLGTLTDRGIALPVPPAWLLRALPVLLVLLLIGAVAISYCIARAICDRKEY